ncbi:MAG: hypothetical protein AAB224_10115 [Gemmatimonadota bacterium]
MTIRRSLMAAASLGALACGGAGKTPAPDTSAAGEAPASAADSAASVADSVRADSSRRAADSLAKTAAKAGTAKMADSNAAPGDYDRALKPKFSIDEKTGKVTPIKRPR